MVSEQRESQRMVPAEFPRTAGVQPRTAGVQPESQRLAQVEAGPLRPLVPPPQAAALGCRFSFAGRR